jgi:hypothetical protein
VLGGVDVLSVEHPHHSAEMPGDVRAQISHDALAVRECVLGPPAFGATDEPSTRCRCCPVGEEAGAAAADRGSGLGRVRFAVTARVITASAEARSAATTHPPDEQDPTAPLRLWEQPAERASHRITPATKM